MRIGTALRELREAKNLSQGDIERRTGLRRAYTSRVEHGHTVPTIETLEKYVRALEIPLYHLFTDEDAVKMVKLSESESNDWGSRGKQRAELRKFVKALSQMNEQDQKLLLSIAEGMARRGAKR
jgi:transcriptional regulator with XRE-family HTH domain